MGAFEVDCCQLSNWCEAKARYHFTLKIFSVSKMSIGWSSIQADELLDNVSS